MAHVPSYETGVGLATRKLRDALTAAQTVGPRRIMEGVIQSDVDLARRGVRELGEAGGLVGLTAKRLAATGELAGDVAGGYMKHVAEPTAQAVNVLAFGAPVADPESRRLQRQAAAKSVPPSEAHSTAVSGPATTPPGAAVGPDTLKTEQAGEDKPGREPDYYDRVKAIRMPNGKIVFTNVAPELTKKGGKYVDYAGAVSEVSGRPWTGGANVVESPSGYRAYVQPGAERAVAAAIPARTPTLEEALPPTTDPQALMERRAHLAARAAEEAAARQRGAELTKSEAEAASAVAAAAVDPMEKARLEAEARYGGDVLKVEQQAAKTKLAVDMLNKINDQMNELRRVMPAGPERDAELARLEELRKLYLIAIHPEAASGLMRPDPYAAFAAPPAPAAAAPAK